MITFTQHKRIMRLKTKRARAAAMAKLDWTVDPKTGCSNSSPEFGRLCSEVERIIRSDARMLMAGRADSTAGLIMAQLAHEHGLKPSKRRASLTTNKAEKATP